LNDVELALTIAFNLINIYFLLIITRTYVLSFYALRYRKKLRKYGVNKSLLARRPFVSVMIPVYNEPNVVDRILRACVELDYDNYEVIVVDDSTDETIEKLCVWAKHPRVKVIHRNHRTGWKGGALDEGLKQLNPKSEFILVFDADFIPPRDIIKKLLSRFLNEKIAAVQGYHLSILNADENWVTRAARVNLSFGYAIDMAGRAGLGGAPQLGGSVMMIRRKVLEEVGGFGHSITEDYDLTLRLYEHGYEVFYDETVKVPCECPSTLRHFIRQTCRWVEGRMRDFRRRITTVLKSKKLPLRKKLDLLMDGLTNLSAPFFMFCLAWTVISPLLSLRVTFFLELLHVPWPVHAIYTLYTMACLPFAQMVALKKEGEKRTAKWIACFLLALGTAFPFYARACLKGAFTNTSYFYRTYKTGKITRLYEQAWRLRVPTGIMTSSPYLSSGVPSILALAQIMNFLSRRGWLL